MAMHASEIAEQTDGLWWTVPKDKTKNSWREHATDFRVPLIGRAERIVRRRLEVAAGGYLLPSKHCASKQHILWPDWMVWQKMRGNRRKSDSVHEQGKLALQSSDLLRKIGRMLQALFRVSAL